jgi:hypothetical protein
MRRTEGDWAKMVAASERSGLPLLQFAARNGVKVSTLKWWRSRFRGGQISFAAVEVAPAGVEVTPVVPAARVRFDAEFGSGLRLSLDVPRERAVLDAVLAALVARA